MVGETKKKVMKTLINTTLFEEQQNRETFNGRNKKNSIQLNIKKFVKRIVNIECMRNKDIRKRFTLDLQMTFTPKSR